MAGDITIKDSVGVTKTVDTNDIGGVDTQVVNLRIGSEGTDEGLIGNDNPLPVTLANVFRILVQKLSRYKFTATSGLTVAVESLPTLGTVNTVGTVTTMTTGNVGLGDIGKQGTAISHMANTFQSTVGKNFIRG